MVMAGVLTIDVGDYRDAFETWLHVSGASLKACQALLDALAVLPATGVYPIPVLCEQLYAYRKDNGSDLLWDVSRDVTKSCLLDRLIYGKEKLRTVPCPVHQGKWSGCSFDHPPCEYCYYGSNVTGWVRHDYPKQILQPQIGQPGSWDDID